MTNPNLHSTMYLFQPDVEDPGNHQDQYLHSTMYLFQRYRIAPRETSPKVFTFHYVSISTVFGYSIDIHKVLIYIPLCIYFNLFISFCRFNMNCIYIPLCIYFNIFLLPIICNIRINLHSTMYLFQPNPALFNYYQVKKIYIPLCIYFNAIWTKSLQVPSQFTFHYVSISTTRTGCWRCAVISFTFHYVSISTISYIKYH